MLVAYLDIVRYLSCHKVGPSLPVMRQPKHSMTRRSFLTQVVHSALSGELGLTKDQVAGIVTARKKKCEQCSLCLDMSRPEQGDMRAFGGFARAGCSIIGAEYEGKVSLCLRAKVRLRSRWRDILSRMARPGRTGLLRRIMTSLECS